MNRIVTGTETASAARYVGLGDAIFDRFARTLDADGRVQQLEPRVSGVLECLIENAGIPVTRDSLLDRVWGEDGSDEALTQTVSRLRKLLGGSAEIRTQPKVGYVLATQPRTLSAPGEGARQPAAAAPPPPRPGIPLWAGITMGALGMALAAVIVFFSFFRIERETEIITYDPDVAEAALPRTAD